MEYSVDLRAEQLIVFMSKMQAVVNLHYLQVVNTGHLCPLPP